MKKLFALLLALCLIIGMTACSGGNSGEAAATGSKETGLKAASLRMR